MPAPVAPLPSARAWLLGGRISLAPQRLDRRDVTRPTQGISTDSTVTARISAMAAPKAWFLIGEVFVVALFVVLARYGVHLF